MTNREALKLLREMAARHPEPVTFKVYSVAGQRGPYIKVDACKPGVKLRFALHPPFRKNEWHLQMLTRTRGWAGGCIPIQRLYLNGQPTYENTSNVFNEALCIMGDMVMGVDVA